MDHYELMKELATKELHTTTNIETQMYRVVGYRYGSVEFSKGVAFEVADNLNLLVRLSDNTWWIDEPTGGGMRNPIPVSKRYAPNPRKLEDLPERMKGNLAMLMTTDTGSTIDGVGSRLDADTFWVEGWK